MPIYVMDEAARTRIEVKLEMTNGRFMNGATEFHRRDGSRVIAIPVRRGARRPRRARAPRKSSR